MHHVVLLDDSLSMRDREGDSTVFQQALQTLENMLTEGSQSTGCIASHNPVDDRSADDRLFRIAFWMLLLFRKSCRDFAI